MHKHFFAVFYPAHPMPVCRNNGGALQSLQNFSGSNPNTEDSDASFEFSVYRKPILQAFLQHGLEVDAVPEEGKQAEPSRQEQCRIQALDALGDRQRKGCRHKTKEHEKAQTIPAEGGRNRSDIKGVFCDTARDRWVVSWSINGKRHQKIFSGGRHGAGEAYQKSVEWRRKMVEEGAKIKRPLVPDQDFRRRLHVKGVSYDTTKHRWMATLRIKGIAHRRCFLVSQYGAEEAYRNAVQWRRKMVEERAEIKRPPAPDQHIGERPCAIGASGDTAQ